MARSRPCSVCTRIFTPHPKAGDRQKACSRPECQRERHRRNCADWHSRNPGYDRERRLRERLEVAKQSQRGPALAHNPIAALPWDVVRDAVGPEVQVLLEAMGQLLVQWARDVVLQELVALHDKLGGIEAVAARDAFGSRDPPA